jgi:hypothetical protein
LTELFADGKPQPETTGPIAERYGLDLDRSTIPACAPGMA